MSKQIRSGGDGCDLFPSCLNCLLPRCQYDLKGGRRKLITGRRNKEIKRLSKEGRSSKELAERFGLSKRLIQRVVKKGESKPTKHRTSSDVLVLSF